MSGLKSFSLIMIKCRGLKVRLGSWEVASNSGETGKQLVRGLDLVKAQRRL